jgi:hypothetical protein
LFAAGCSKEFAEIPSTDESGAVKSNKSAQKQGKQQAEETTRQSKLKTASATQPAFLDSADSLALWIWSGDPTTRALISNENNTRSDFLTFLDAQKADGREIDRVFLEAREKSTPSIYSDLYTVDYDPVSKGAHRDDLQTFIQKAAQKGTSVEYLDGQAIWLATDQNAKVPKQICKDVVDYNEDSAASEKFAGIHFDIQPHKINQGPYAGEWYQNRLPNGYNREWTQRWKDILDSCKATVDDYEARTGHTMTFSTDLASNYAHYNQPIRKYLNEKGGPVDYVTVKNFFDNRRNRRGNPTFFHGSYDGLTYSGGVEQNLQYFTKVPVLFGMSYGPPSVIWDQGSFYQEGESKMFSVADTLTSDYGNQNIVGSAIEHYPLDVPEDYSAGDGSTDGGGTSGGDSSDGSTDSGTSDGTTDDGTSDGTTDSGSADDGTSDGSTDSGGTNDDSTDGTESGGSTDGTSDGTDSGGSDGTTDSGGTSDGSTDGTSDDTTDDGTSDDSTDSGGTSDGSSDDSSDSTDDSGTTDESTDSGGTTDDSTDDSGTTDDSTDSGGTTDDSTDDSGTTDDSTDSGGTTDDSTDDTDSGGTSDDSTGDSATGTDPFPTDASAIGLWLWSGTPSLQNLLTNGNGAQDELFMFLANHRQDNRTIDRIFLEGRHKDPSNKFSELYDYLYDPVNNTAERPKLRDFISRANGVGTKIEYLDGQAIWLATDANAEVPKQICKDVVAYNESSVADECFAGVHFDIEPHTVTSGPHSGQWWANRLPDGYNADWTRRWKEILTSCSSTIDDYESRTGDTMTFSGDIGADYGYYNEPIRTFLNDPNGPLDYVTIMNYYDNRSNQNGNPTFFYGAHDGNTITGGVEQNLSKFDQVPLMLGMSAGPTSIAPDEASFYQEGTSAMYTVIDQLIADYASQNVVGVAIHHYAPNSYKSIR